MTWGVEASKTLYNTAGWGEPYFTINDAGNLAVRPTGGRFAAPARAHGARMGRAHGARPMQQPRSRLLSWHHAPS